MEKAIKMAGAELVIQSSPHQRWQYIEDKVKNEGWYPATNYTHPRWKQPFWRAGLQNGCLRNRRIHAESYARRAARSLLARRLVVGDLGRFSGSREVGLGEGDSPLVCG